MDKASVLKRKEELEQQRIQLIANLNAVVGAMQDCEYWLGQFDKPVVESTPTAADSGAPSETNT
jgi:hypothetical protein